MRTIEICGKEHPTAHDALVELNFSGDHAISIAAIRGAKGKRLMYK